MVTNNTHAIKLVANNLHVGVPFLASSKVFISLPLEGLEFNVEVGQVFFSELLACIFFAETTGSVFDGSEDTGRYTVVVHLLSSISK